MESVKALKALFCHQNTFAKIILTLTLDIEVDRTLGCPKEHLLVTADTQKFIVKLGSLPLTDHAGPLPIGATTFTTSLFRQPVQADGSFLTVLAGEKSLLGLDDLNLVTLLLAKLTGFKICVVTDRTADCLNLDTLRIQHLLFHGISGLRLQEISINRVQLRLLHQLLV